MKKFKYLDFFLLLCFFHSFDTLVATKVNKGSNKHNPRMSKLFVGEITRNLRFVELDQPLIAIDKDAPARMGLICEFKLSSVDFEDSEILFNVEVLNQNEGIISLKPYLNLSDCSFNQTEFHYYITAFDCGTDQGKDGYINQRNSHPSKLSILLKETNNFRPAFLSENITLKYDKNIIGGSPLVSLQATDRDCSSRYGNICGYKISGSEFWDKRFKIVDGVLMSKHLIISTQIKQVINLKIQAKDCDSLYSLPTHVNIIINPICLVGWTDIEKRVEFSSMTSSVSLYPQPALQLCISPLDVAGIKVDITLDPENTGCSNNLENNIRICDASEEEKINILPTLEKYNQISTPFLDQDQQIPSSLPILTKNSLNREVYKFNGENVALIVKDNQLQTSLNALDLTSNYSIFFKMSLKSQLNKTFEKKSTIVCKSDKTGLSRHHFAVYVQNCHLMLLIRRERGERGSLAPAEWHWKLNGNSKKACDNKLIDVLINVQFPNVTLYLDGIAQIPFLVADDYPLLRSRHPLIWTVGAAWQGRTSEMVQHFYGQISDLGISPYLQDANATQCVPECKEGIKTTNDVIGQGVNNNDALKKDAIDRSNFHLSFTSSNVDEVTNLLKTITYFNSKPFTLPGKRAITMTTKIICDKNATKCPYIAQKVTLLMLTPPPNPQILIQGKGHLARSIDDITRLKGHGIYLFDDITIVSKANAIGEVDVIGPQHSIDYCIIKETNDVVMGKFHVRPQQILRENGIQVENQQSGIILRGTQNLGSYEIVLRSLIYTNHNALNLMESLFNIKCFESSEKFNSNMYTVTLEVLHPYTESTSKSNNEFEVPISLVSSDGLHDGSLIPNKGARVQLEEVEQAAHMGKRLFQIGNDPSRKDYTTPIIMAGSGIILLTLLVVAGVFHVRLQGGDREADVRDLEEERVVEEGDLDWDDSAMTITINPMENAADAAEASDNDFSELDEDDVSCDHVRETHLVGCKSRDPALLERHIRRPEDYYDWDGQ